MANGKVNQPAPITADLAGAIDPGGLVQGLQLDSSKNLKVSGSFTANNTANGNTGSAVPAQATQVGGSDGTNLRALKVSTAGVLSVDGSAVTQPVSAASLPLPAGASTSAKQPALGTAGSASADVLSVQGIASMTALKVDGSAVTQPVSGTVTADAGSGTFAVSAASLPLPSGAATAAKQPALGTAGSASADVISVQGIASMTALKVDGSGVTQPISGTVTANAGSGTMAVSLATLPALTTGAAVIGAVTQSGTWTVQPGNTANTTAWLVKESVSATSTLTNVASSATSVSLLASNSSRLGAAFFNDSTQICYLKLGATASATSYTVQLSANAYYELPPAHIYTGAIDAIWASANGNMRVTELS